MATYQLIQGKSTIPPGGPGTAEKTFKEGETCETDMKLDEMWPEKWVKVGEDAPVRKGRKGMKATPKPKQAEPPPEEEEEEVEDLEGDDVTDQFDLAEKNDLKVMHITGTGYTIFDGKKAVNEEPLRTKPQTVTRLKDYVGEK